MWCPLQQDRNNLQYYFPCASGFCSIPANSFIPLPHLRFSSLVIHRIAPNENRLLVVTCRGPFFSTNIGYLFVSWCTLLSSNLLRLCLSFFIALTAGWFLVSSRVSSLFSKFLPHVLVLAKPNGCTLSPIALVANCPLLVENVYRTCTSSSLFFGEFLLYEWASFKYLT